MKNILICKLASVFSVFFILLIFTIDAKANREADSINHIIDSIKISLNTTKSDSEIVLKNIKIVEVSLGLGTQADTGLIRRCLSIASEKSKKIPFKNGLAQALLLSSKIEISKTHNFGKATNYLLEAKKFFKEENDSLGISRCWSQLGLISHLLQYYEEAIKCFHEALVFNKAIDLPSGIANYLTALSYTELNELNEAEKFFFRAIEIYKKIGKNHGLVECYIYMAKMYVMNDKIDEANIYFEKIDSLTDIELDRQTIGRTLAIKSGAYLKMNQIDLAIKTGLEAHKIAEDLNDELTIAESDKQLYQAFRLKGDFRNAFYYLNELKQMNETLYSLNAGQRVAEIRSKFEFENQILIEQQAQEKKDVIAKNELERQKVIRNSILAFLIVAIVFLVIVFIQRSNLAKAKKQSEELLLNILPETVAEELKKSDKVLAENYNLVSVLFTDFKDFTKVTSNLTAKELVTEIDYYFSAFDKIISKYNIEKIKTIGDAYMCASGVPRPNLNHAVDIVDAAIEIQNFVLKTAELRKADNRPYFLLRCGVNSGPVVAGVVGSTKFAYDIWGDTVNIASRMESGGETSRVNVSGETYELIKQKYKCTYRGKIEAKNRGMLDMYFVDGLIA